MENADGEKLFEKGLQALARNDTLAALAYFERAVHVEDRPLYSSHLAFCIAKERGQYQLAVTLCEKAIAKEPRSSVHRLNLGRIYVIAKKKSDAIRTFREGLQHEKNPQIIEELDRLGTRKPPVIPFLKRENIINKYLGIALHRIGLR
ncbi:MAG TPA: hypothetical protein VEI96_10070 [Thermodesulfovibrionales bacterium]|nr:hypothetical protein [Thermodesulfovibrionales bacterium]